MALKWLLILLGYFCTYGIWTATDAVDILTFTAFSVVCFGGAMFIDFGKRMK